MKKIHIKENLMRKEYIQRGSNFQISRLYSEKGEEEQWSSSLDSIGIMACASHMGAEPCRAMISNFALFPGFKALTTLISPCHVASHFSPFTFDHSNTMHDLTFSV